MNNKESSERLIFIGEIIKPHGLRGHLKFFLYNENSDVLLDIDSIYLETGSSKIKLDIEDINLTSSIPLIKFFGINSREKAEKYKKYKICLSKSVFQKDIKDLYLFDFIGCDIYFNDDYIGVVKDVLTFSGNDLLLVKSVENKEHYVPINKKLIKFFDIEDRKLVMNNIEGLLDIC